MMSTLLVLKEQLRGLYAKYSFYMMVAMRFMMGLLVFGLINANIGFMEAASSILVTLGLAAVCAFLPMIIMTMAATVLVLVHLYSISLGIAAVAAVSFLLMYIFYFRFTSRISWVVLLTVVGFTLKIPFVVPLAIGLLGTPICLIPVVCGTFSYYMLHLVKTSSTALKGAEGVAAITDSLMSFAKQCMANKEMWIMMVAVVLCGLVVYGVRKLSIDHAWKIASVAGSLIAIIVAVVGNVALDLHISYGLLIVGGILAIVAGLILEVLFLSVDYTRTELLEFEDDEYHYYVKAVPKFGVTVPEKSVKHINERQDEEEEIKDADRLDETRLESKRSDSVQEPLSMEHTEQILLAESLNKELGLDDTKQV